MCVLLGTALNQGKHSKITESDSYRICVRNKFLRNYDKSMRLHTCQGTEEQSPQTVLLLNITPFLPLMIKNMTFIDFNIKSSHTYVQIYPVVPIIF